MDAKKITLDSVRCCALVHAFMRNPKLTGQWGRAVGGFELFYLIFDKTESITFVPNEQTILTYRAFAKAELEHLNCKNADAKFRCHHSIIEHRNTLESLLQQLPKAN